MSGVSKVTKKFTKGLRKVLKSDTFRKALTVVVVAAAIYFTAGAASGAFAAPAAGAGTAGASMTGVAGATGAAGASGAAAVSAPVVGLTGSAAGGVGAGMATSASPSAFAAAPAVSGGSGGLVASQAGGVLQNPMAGMQGPKYTPAQMAAMENTAASLPPARAPGSGIMGWMQKNPMVTMMLGQAGSGAYQGYLMDKQMEREDKRYRDRGLMGYDAKGRYGGGVVSSQMQRPNVDPAAATAPAVTPPSEQQRKLYPVAREDLPILGRTGQLYMG